MRRRLTILVLFAALALSAQTQRIKLYIKGGGDITVTEYEVVDDRVRYYSVERRDWEEIPLELVDLDRTKKEVSKRETEFAERRRIEQIETAAERKARTELHEVPLEDGVYYRKGDEVVTVQQAEVVLNTNKKRSILRVVMPIPVAGQTIVELEGATSKLEALDARPVFYMRLEKLSRFGIFRLKQKKDSRVVQEIDIVPQSKEMMEQHDEIEVFRQQFAGQVYRVWPIEPLTAGEYAFVEYTLGEADIRVWDFSVPASVGAPPAPKDADEGKKDKSKGGKGK